MKKRIILQCAAENESMKNDVSGTDRNISVERENILILSSDPKCIIVRVRNRTVDFYISCAHAPFLQTTTDHKKWSETFNSQVENTCGFGELALVGIDQLPDLWLQPVQ